MSRPKTSLLKPLLLLGLSLASTLAATGLWIQITIDRTWAAMEQSVKQQVEVARSASTHRQVLYGTPVPGNAWDDYLPALEGCRKVAGGTPKINSFVGELLNRYPKSPPTEETCGKLAVVLLALQPDFERLLRGSRRADRSYPCNWGDLVPCDSLSALPHSRAQMFTNLGVLEARRQAEAGRSGEALALLLALVSMGRDLGDNGSPVSLMVGWGVVRTVGDELYALVEERRFDRDQLMELGNSLDLLDQDFFRYGPTLRNELIAYGHLFQRGGFLRESPILDGPAPSSIRAGWRHAYSMRALQAAALLQFDGWSSRVVRLESRPFPEMREGLDELRREVERTRNPWALTLGRPIPECVVLPELRARLRLIRTAALYRATGEWRVLEDPCGSVLRSGRSGDKLRIWSAGRDGIDDGGAPKKDVVLDLEP